MFPSENTDREWEKFGQRDPYYGVLSADRFHRNKMTSADYDAFFSSGAERISQVMQIIRSHFDEDFKPDHAVDFGCGVGRLAIPLARTAQRVTGLDVSEAMLAEARQNSERSGAGNISFKISDDALTRLEEGYNLIISEIVFQHIPTRRGYKIFAELIRRLAKGGVGYFQFPYRRSYGLIKETYYFFRTQVPGAGTLVNAVKRRPLDAPFMQMNVYDLNRLMELLQANRIALIYNQLFAEGEYKNIYMFFQK